jgi:hypothetical protein
MTVRGERDGSGSPWDWLRWIDGYITIKETGQTSIRSVCSHRRPNQMPRTSTANATFIVGKINIIPKRASRRTRRGAATVQISAQFQRAAFAHVRSWIDAPRTRSFQ